MLKHTPTHCRALALPHHTHTSWQSYQQWNIGMTHFNILTGVNGIFDDLEAFSLSMLVYGRVCVCVGIWLHLRVSVCNWGSRQLAPDSSLSYFHGRIPPSPTARTLCALRANCWYYRKAPQPLGRAGTAAAALSPKPLKLPSTQNGRRRLVGGATAK